VDGDEVGVENGADGVSLTGPGQPLPFHQDGERPHRGLVVGRRGVAGAEVLGPVAEPVLDAVDLGIVTLAAGVVADDGTARHGNLESGKERATRPGCRRTAQGARLGADRHHDWATRLDL
jgi:hypothetical protein